MKFKNKHFFVYSLILFIVYYLSGRFGLRLNTVGGFATLIWLPTGISLASLLIFGYRLWPAITLGAFAVNLMNGASWQAALGISIGNTLEAVFGVYLFKNFIGKNVGLDRLRDVILYITVVATLSTITSATIGTFTIYLSKTIVEKAFLGTWLTWWVGDLISALVITPLIMFWFQPFKIGVNIKRFTEMLVTLILLLLVSAYVFSGLFTGLQTAPVTYILFFPLILIALRFSQRATATATFILSLIAVWFTVHGQGPFSGRPLSEDLLYLQGFMFATSTTMLIMSTSLREREQSEIRKNEFISLASHELKTPTTTIKAYTQLLRKNPALKRNKELRRYLGRMENQLNKLTRLVVDLLDVSKLLSDRLDLHRNIFPVQTLVKDSVDDMKLITKSHKILLYGKTNKRVNADKERIGQVIENLLTNAIKYSPKAKTVVIRVKTDTKHVIIGVQDHGYGIDEKYHGFLFQRFFRANELPISKLPGLGLGLFLANEIIKRHGGKLWFKSKPNKGSTFYFSLPTEV